MFMPARLHKLTCNSTYHALQTFVRVDNAELKIPET